MQLANTVFSGSTGNVGVIARGVPVAVRLTVGDIDADGDAVPHLLFGEGSFTVPAGNPGLRITGGDLKQTNSASIVVAESESTTPGFEDPDLSEQHQIRWNPSTHSKYRCYLCKRERSCDPCNCGAFNNRIRSALIEVIQFFISSNQVFEDFFSSLCFSVFII